MAQVRLGYWSPNGGYARIYVNGLNVPKGFRVHLEHKASKVVVKFNQAGSGMTEDQVLAELRQFVPDPVNSWDSLVNIANRVSSAGSPGGGFSPGLSHSGAGGSYGRPTPEWEKNQRPWVPADFEALADIDMSSDPIPAPTVLQVDHREPDEMIAELRSVNNLVVEVSALPVADYVVPGLLMIERKTSFDFVTSITEDAKRLFFQSEAMAQSDVVSRVVLIEGDLHESQRMGLKQIAGAVSYLAIVQGCSVIFTMNLRHSALLIAKMTRHAAHGLGYDLGLRGTAPREPKAAAAYVLEGIPGVSAARAILLLKHFGTLAAISGASVKELQAVASVGPAIATQIQATFSAIYP